MDDEQIADLRQRITSAMNELDGQAAEEVERSNGVTFESQRLYGKVQGLALALDYLRAQAPISY